jgi:hypothetical protein
MSSQSARTPEQPSQESGPGWQIKLLLGLIGGGVLALILKIAGLF